MYIHVFKYIHTAILLIFLNSEFSMYFYAKCVHLYYSLKDLTIFIKKESKQNLLLKVKKIMYACIYFFLQNKMSNNMTVKINHIDFLHKFVIHIKINILLNVENKKKFI